MKILITRFRPRTGDYFFIVQAERLMNVSACTHTFPSPYWGLFFSIP